MSRNFMVGSFSFLAVTITAASLFAQAAATPPSAQAKDREAHSKTKPQETSPRVKSPNTDTLGNKLEAPSPDNPVLDPDDLEATREAAKEDSKPSEIRSTATTTTTSRRSGRTGVKTDTMLSTSAAIDSQKEIILAAIAEERAQLPATKSFAMAISHDHQALLEKLRRYAPDATKPGYLNMVMPSAAPGTEVTSLNTPAGRVLPTNSIDDKPNPSSKQAAPLGIVNGIPTTDSIVNPIELMHVERDIAGIFLAQNKDFLDQKNGTDFDRAFLIQQVTFHTEMKSKFSVYRRHVSREVAAVMNDGEQMSEMHLSKAKLLLKSLDISSATAEEPAAKAE